jgi:hypothetical protein
MSLVQHFINIHSIYRYAGMFQPVANMQEAMSLVIRYHIKSEKIGQWLYCFTTPLIGFQLERIGFWYSFKHSVWVFSGTEKETPAGNENLDEIRWRLGCQQVMG